MSCSPSMPFLLLSSTDRGHVSTGLNRDLLIDISNASLLTGFSFDASGSAQVSGCVPNDPALHDTSLFIQAVDLLPQGGLHLTNSIEVWIR